MKACVINQSSHIHFYDHLCPFAVVMDIPSLFMEEDDRERCARYYPGLKTDIIEFQDFNPEFLIQNFDVIMMSDLWDRDVFNEKFRDLEKQYKKTLKHVHVPHGFSDKVFYIRKMANEDITLVYGQNMLDLLKEEGVFERLNKYVISGNYRYTYYKQNKEHLDRLAKDEVLGDLDPSKKTILYAPTWLDLEESTTFFDAHAQVIDKVPDEYNLIVKLHPRLELDDTVGFYEIMGKYAQRKNIIFVTAFPMIYPLLAKTDIYIGDMSSIGYDFLPFNKPMFFINKGGKVDRRTFLYQCGTVVEDLDNLYSFVEKTKDTFSEKRLWMNEYTFGKERSFEEIREDVFKTTRG